MKASDLAIQFVCHMFMQKIILSLVLNITVSKIR